MGRYYFDHNATTPVLPEVMHVLLPALTEVYGNPSSIHQDGQTARQHLEDARRAVCALLHCAPKEMVALSGGTEGDNLALLGVLRASTRSRRHLITTAIEHPAVLNTCAQLEQEGVEVTYLRPSPQGVIEPEAVARALRVDTVLVSVMHANNETGVIQPVEEIGRIARKAGVLFHSDGVQAAGKIPVDVTSLPVDLYTISAHKLYAPKGAGALYARDSVKVKPLQYGGRHERSRRAGTENVPGMVAMGAAARLAARDLGFEQERQAALRDCLEQGIESRIPNVRVNGGGAARVPNTTNIAFDGIDGEALVIALDLRGFSLSTGAACSSGAVEPSHVLTAMGLSRDQARSSLRFSLGRGNTEQQVADLIEAVAESAARLRRLSPTYV